LRPPPLGIQDEALRQKILSDAISRPALVAQLPLVDASTLFNAMTLLSAAERKRAREPFLDLSTVGAQSGAAGVEAVAGELARVVHELSPEERNQLRNPLAVEPLVSQYRHSTLPLIRSDPALLSEASLQSAWQVLAQNFDVRTAEFEAVTLGFSVNLGRELVPDFLNALNQLLVDAIAKPQIQDRTFEGILTALRRLSRLTENEMTTLVGTIQSNFPTLAASNEAAATAFALEVAEILLATNGELPAASSGGQQLAASITQQAPLSAATYLTRSTDAVSDELRDIIVTQIEALLPSYTDARQRLRLLRAVLTARNGQSRVLEFLQGLVNEVEIDALSTLLGPLSPELGKGLNPLLDAIYEFANATPGYALRGIRPIVATIRFGVLSFAKRLMDDWEQLTAGQRSEVRKAFVRLLRRDEKYATAISRLVLSVKLRAADRNSLVRAFLAIYRSGSTGQVRRRALETATALARPSRPLRRLVDSARREMADR
jgi:hypothetical protein